MKVTEIETPAELDAFLQRPGRDWSKVVLQALDLTGFDSRLADQNLCHSTVFVGCHLGPELARKVIDAGCLTLTPRPGIAFNPYRKQVYHACDLFNGFNPDQPESYRQCLDWAAYLAAMDETKRQRRADLTLADELLFRLHDFSQEDALMDFLKPDPWNPNSWKKVVAIMGGHDLDRAEKKTDAGEEADAPYMQIALIARALTLKGYLIATGGGPGAMEAANLGACLAHHPEAVLRQAVRDLSTVPKILQPDPAIPRWNSGEWLAPAMRVLEDLPAGTPLGESVGIPTWFYGHEPPNPFATHIAKYFENSLREEGLLAIANHGVLFARGNAGTVQEVFQDACQNYYGTYGTPAPMILFDSAYWHPESVQKPEPKAKPVWPLLRQLASERTKQGFPDVLLLTDSIDEAVGHILALTPSPPPPPQR